MKEKVNNQLIIAFIDGHLSKEQKRYVRMKIDSDPDWFLQYMELKESIFEMENKDLDAEIEKLNAEEDITASSVISSKEKIYIKKNADASSQGMTISLTQNQAFLFASILMIVTIAFLSSPIVQQPSGKFGLIGNQEKIIEVVQSGSNNEFYYIKNNGTESYSIVFEFGTDSVKEILAPLDSISITEYVESGVPSIKIYAIDKDGNQIDIGIIE
tara:strand:+ start:1569 stop:2210 length:642 start_codon:yes stop_codon:yes gene_type:complete